jgi:hypothetical protein
MDLYCKNTLFIVSLMIIINLSFLAILEAERDPFVSLGEIMQAQEAEIVNLPYAITLKGTLRLGNTLVAIVNDDIIKEGQRWKEFYVAKIERAKVILEWKHKKFEIVVGGQADKKEK